MNITEILSCLCPCFDCSKRRTMLSPSFEHASPTWALSSGEHPGDTPVRFEVGDYVCLKPHNHGDTKIVGIRGGSEPIFELATQVEIPRDTGDPMTVAWLWHAPISWVEHAEVPGEEVEPAANGAPALPQVAATAEVPTNIPVALGDLVRYRNRPDHDICVNAAVVTETAFQAPKEVTWHKPSTGETSAGPDEKAYQLLLRVWSVDTAGEGDWIEASQIVEVIR